MMPIETNTGRERLRLLRQVGEGVTARLEGEGFTEPGAGPPLHVHYWQDEGFRVVAGRLGYQLAGGEPKYSAPVKRPYFRRESRIGSGTPATRHCTRRHG